MLPFYPFIGIYAIYRAYFFTGHWIFAWLMIAEKHVQTGKDLVMKTQVWESEPLRRR